MLKRRAFRESGQQIMKFYSELSQFSIKGTSTQLRQAQCALK